MPRRWLVILLLPLLVMTSLHAQEVEWSVDASVLLNNREGDNPQCPDQTFMFTRLAPEVGLSLHDGEHVFKGGVVWYQPMIDDMDGYKVLPTVYYQYNRPDGWHVTLGMLPRSLLVQRMPRYLWSDSLAYTQPNLRGGVVQLIKPAGYAEVAIDWRQMQTWERREAFTAFLNTQWRVLGPVSLEGHVQYSHLARSRRAVTEPANTEHVNDDLVVNPMAVLDWSRRTVLDSLRLSAGAIIAYERNRGNNTWRNPAGFVATATVRWRWLQLDETLYAGKDLMPLYDEYGSQLNQGDAYYRSRVYSRTDLTARVVHTRCVDLSASLMLHLTDKFTGFWQQITCRFYLDNRLWRHRHDRSCMGSGMLEPLY